MAVFDNLNYSYSQGVAPGIVDYYMRTLLRDEKDELVHGRDAQKRTIPKNNGKRVQFRKFTPLVISTKPLVEGQSAVGQTITQTEQWAHLKTYGGHVEITDELDLYHLDNLHQEIAQLLSDQAYKTIDTIERDTFNAGMNVQYAGANTARGTIAATDKLDYATIKKAVRTLERKNCKVFPDGFYHAIVHPDVVYDLTSDSMFTDTSKYQDKAKVEKYELGTIWKVKFFVSNNAKKFTGDTYVYGTTTSLTASADYDATNRCMTVTATLTEADKNELLGKMVDVNWSSTYKYPMCIENVEIGASTAKIYFRYQPGSSITNSWTTSNTLKILPSGKGNSVDVYSTIVYGQNAFGDVELEGGGNVRIIINAPGSSGAADPEAQRGTIAWKVQGFGCTILQDDFIVRIESGATA